MRVKRSGCRVYRLAKALDKRHDLVDMVRGEEHVNQAHENIRFITLVQARKLTPKPNLSRKKQHSHQILQATRKRGTPGIAVG